ncbi:MAG: tryptophan synthase subunit alpha [Candidatus Omnitrophota bacterium]
MSEITDRFKQLKEKDKKAFVLYLTFGFPSIDITRKILFSLGDSPVDLVELGLPFSDPLADGPILQEASNIALENGANVDNFFSFLKELKGVRRQIKIPLIIMTYYNLVLQFGPRRFLANARQCGISGIMIVDLPIEEASCYIDQARSFNLDTIFFVTPETTQERMKKIVEASRGFVYYISATGITGPRSLSLESIRSHAEAIKKVSNLPVCVGFGIHNKKQVKSLGKVSDGVIVGSVVARFIKENYKTKNFVNNLNNFLKNLYV